MWSKGAVSSQAIAYISKNLLSGSEFANFTLHREWLENALRLDAKPYLGQLGEPTVLLYGSAIAGTAFVRGDADFAVAFRTQIPLETDSSISLGSTPGQTPTPRVETERFGDFHVVKRDQHPEVLNALYDSLVKHTGSRFQRIFKARVPILQFSPELSILQSVNSTELVQEAEGDADAAAALQSIEDSKSSSASATETVEEAVVAKGSSVKLDRSSKRLSDLVSSTNQKSNEPGKNTGVSASQANSRKPQQLDLSLSVDGCRNSLLIRQYMQQYPVLHLLTMTVKLWGRHQKLLNARSGWLSPYALTVMALHYAIEAKLVPTILDELAVNELLGNPPSLLPFPSSHAEFQKDSFDFESILKGFFEYYSGPFDFDTDVVDIRSRQRITKKVEWFSEEENKTLTEAQKWHRVGYQVMMIRDPFENHSLGRSVEFFRGEALREAFRLASIKGLPPTLFDASPQMK
jgi:hypothetical protein